MSEALANLLDLRTAWGRVKDDIANRVFIRHPYSVSLVESELEGWLEHRLNLIREDKYVPESAFICDVPKGSGLIRPGAHLSYTDRLVYTACVGACFPAIHRRLKWSQGTTDFSYRLAALPSNPKWLKDRFTGWQDFRQRSLALIEGGAAYVVMTDITAFYENIDLSLLFSDLRSTGAPEEAINQLSACLNKWAQVPGGGIPQGQSPSDILAKLYLNNIDEKLRNMGYQHLRYVDDTRVFCNSLTEAKKVLVDLSRLLRRRGLNLQSAKSQIHRADNARAEIEEVTTEKKANPALMKPMRPSAQLAEIVGAVVCFGETFIGVDPVERCAHFDHQTFRLQRTGNVGHDSSSVGYEVGKELFSEAQLRDLSRLAGALRGHFWWSVEGW